MSNFPQICQSACTNYQTCSKFWGQPESAAVYNSCITECTNALNAQDQSQGQKEYAVGYECLASFNPQNANQCYGITSFCSGIQDMEHIPPSKQ